MKTGDICLVNLDPTIGAEIKKKRPVVILNPGHAKSLRLAIVVPVTGWKQQWEDNPFFVPLDPNSDNGLDKRSTVDCFQLRAISHDRFTETIGRVRVEELDSIRTCVALILDIEPQHCE